MINLREFELLYYYKSIFEGAVDNREIINYLTKYLSNNKKFEQIRLKILNNDFIFHELVNDFNSLFFELNKSDYFSNVNVFSFIEPISSVFSYFPKNSVQSLRDYATLPKNVTSSLLIAFSITPENVRLIPVTNKKAFIDYFVVGLSHEYVHYLEDQKSKFIKFDKSLSNLTLNFNNLRAFPNTIFSLYSTHTISKEEKNTIPNSIVIDLKNAGLSKKDIVDFAKKGDLPSLLKSVKDDKQRKNLLDGFNMYHDYTKLSYEVSSQIIKRYNKNKPIKEPKEVNKIFAKFMEDVHKDLFGNTNDKLIKDYFSLAGYADKHMKFTTYFMPFLSLVSLYNKNNKYFLAMDKLFNTKGLYKKGSNTLRKEIISNVELQYN